MSSQKSSLKILVFGAGAIGAYVGGSLILAGHQVVFIKRQKISEQLRERGLRLDLTLDKNRNAKEPFIIDARSYITTPSLSQALAHAPFDIVLFALKSFDTPAALAEIKPFAEKMPPVLCLSNGVDNERLIAETLGADKVIYGTVTTAIGKRGAGDIVLEKLRGVGIAAGQPLSAQLVSTFNTAYLNCRLYENANSMKWSKMLTNLMANPLSAILNMTAAEIFADKNLYQLEIEMLSECLAVMRAQNIAVVDLPRTPVKALAFATKLPLWLSKPLITRALIRGRGAKMPSFHIDLHAGRNQSEVEYLHGAVVNAGKKYNIPTPVNNLLTQTLLALTNKQIPLKEYDHQPEKFLKLVEGLKSKV